MRPTVLADAAYGESKTGVEIAVLDQDVGAVRLERDAVVAVVDYPVPECDVVDVDCIGTVGLAKVVSDCVLRILVGGLPALTFNDEKSNPTGCA